MRTIWLAKAVKKKLNCKIFFIINKNKFFFKFSKLINLSGCIYTNNDKNYDLSFENIKKILKLNPDLLVDDTPDKIKKNWFRILNKNKIKILSITSSYNKYSNYFLMPENHKKIDNQFIKSGFKFSLLSPDFKKKLKPKKNKFIKKILITFGGSDHLDLTSKVLTVLNKSNNFFLIKIIVGKYYNNLNNIKKLIKLSKHRILILKSPVGIYRYLKEADFIINGGGTTSMEINCLSKPCLTFAIWKTQNKLTKNLFTNNSTYVLCSKKKKLLKKEINKKILFFINKNEFKFKFDKKIDGFGCDRSAAWIRDILIKNYEK